jgi:ubiquinone/menaquinone biosynthesis C-methylase UbiE
MFDARDMQMVPSPAEGRYVGDGADFVAVGCLLLKDLVTVGGLQPYENVLDVGCGIGRLAVPLTKYLTAEGSYDGFDVVQHGIDWCRTRITPRYDNFRFEHFDAFHNLYNPTGKLKATDIRFPYPDKSFDFVFLFSIFTHMVPGDVDHNLGEIRRVLRDDGRCFMTAFLLDEPSIQAVRDGKSTVATTISEDLGGYRVIDEEHADLITFYELEYLTRLIEKNGMRLKQPPIMGTWNGLKGPFAAQDYLLIKPA